MSSGSLDLTSQGRPDLRSKGGPKPTSRESVLVEVLRTSLEGPPEEVLRTLLGRLLDVPNFYFTFLLISMQYAEVYLEPSQAYIMKRFCKNRQRLLTANYFRKKAPS